jgi:hypothetical protein
MFISPTDGAVSRNAPIRFGGRRSFRLGFFQKPLVTPDHQDRQSHTGQDFEEFFHVVVPTAGLEPARLSALPPQDSVSANSTRWASNH